MRILLVLFLSVTLSSCAVVEVLKPTDPCSKLFTSAITINQCRVETGIQMEADAIKADALATVSGDVKAHAKLQKRLDKLTQFKDSHRAVNVLFDEGETAQGEAQLELLVQALESIK